MTRIFSENNSLINQFLSELRDVSIQNDSLRFRRNMERIGEIFAYEISKELNYKSKDINTPLGVSKENLIYDKIVNATILRAGLPFHQGFLNYFDTAENAFISSFRKYIDETNFEIAFKYAAMPSLKDKILILSDPMLASGASMVQAYRFLVKKETPNHTYIASIIASREGLDFLQKNTSDKAVTILIGALDPGLNHKKYIVPGLGDAGDLAFGEKL